MKFTLKRRESSVSRFGYAKWAAPLLASTLLLTACTNPTNGQTSNGGSTPDAAPVLDGEICADYQGKRIGVVHLTSADENEGTLVAALEEASTKAGLDWEFLEADSQGEAARSQQAISAFVNQGVDAIILMVVSARDVQAQLEEAQQAGIPVYGQWSFSALNPLIESDYTTPMAPEAAALVTYMFSDLELKYPEGDIDIALVNSNADIFQPRNEVIRGLAEIYPRINIVDSADIDFTDLNGSTTRIVDGFMSKHPDLKAIWTIYPVSAPAAAQAVSAAREDIAVYGPIPQSVGVAALADPENPLEAVSWVDFDYESYKTIEAVLHGLSGNEPNRLEAFEDIAPFKLFTKETAGDLNGAGVASGIGWTLNEGDWKDPLVQSWGGEFQCAS